MARPGWRCPLQRMVRSIILASAGLALVVGAACSDDSKSSASASTTPGGATPTALVTQASGTSSSVAFASPSTAGAPSSAVTNTVELVKKVRPSVVRVRASSAQGAGTGTGFVIDDRGYIVTNNHVVTLDSGRVASSLKVDLADGRTVDAQVTGRDERTDVAVIKIDAGKLTALQFAEPTSIEVGEDVVAVGFALDLGGQPTVSKGVVSALDRTIDEQGADGSPISISGAIQTDAAINPGNSGGPLLDAQGHVVGINTAGLRGSGGTPVEGISFAVSSPVAQPIVRALIDTGVVKRGFLGVSVSQIDRTRADALKIPVAEGARIERIEPGSAAEAAGLKVGDVIVKVGDVDIKNVGDLTRALAQYGPGMKVKAEFYRNGQKQSADITPAERPAGV